MQRGKPVTEPSKQRARLRSITADPRIAEAAFRDGTTPLLSYRSCKANMRPGSMLCRKTWRTAAQPTLCARSVTWTYPNCKASCRPRVLGATEVTHDVIRDAPTYRSAIADQNLLIINRGICSIRRLGQPISKTWGHYETASKYLRIS